MLLNVTFGAAVIVTASFVVGLAGACETVSEAVPIAVMFAVEALAAACATENEFVPTSGFLSVMFV